MSQTGESDILVAVRSTRTLPNADDVRSALRWALDHDLHALMEHRSVAHLGGAARRRADSTLVTRWRLATRACR